MAPIKFEENIKEELEKRRIQPSEDSWNRLRKELDSRKKSGSKRGWWMGSVAALIVIIIIGSFFLRAPQQTSTQIVNEPVKKENNVPGENELQPETPVKLASEDKKEKSKNTRANRNVVKQKPASVQVAEVVRQKKKESKPAPVIGNSLKEPEIKKEGNIALAEVIKMKEEPSWQVSDAEVEKLLESATEKIQKDTLNNVQVPGGKELLAELEETQDQSLKTKAFEFLKEGFQKAKSAVAQRNE